MVKLAFYEYMCFKHHHLYVITNIASTFMVNLKTIGGCLFQIFQTKKFEYTLENLDHSDTPWNIKQ